MHSDLQDQRTAGPQVVNPLSSPRDAADVAACYLWRGPGLPAMAHSLKQSVTFRHGTLCPWCDYPADVLVTWLKEYTDWTEVLETRWTERIQPIAYGSRFRVVQ